MVEVSLTTRQVAVRLRVSVGTLQNWRCQGIGPRFYKLTNGRQGRVRYRLADIERYEAERFRQTRGAAA